MTTTAREVCVLDYVLKAQGKYIMGNMLLVMRFPYARVDVFKFGRRENELIPFFRRIFNQDIDTVVNLGVSSGTGERVHLC